MSSTTYATAEADHEESLFRTSAHALSDAAGDARAHAKVAAQNVKDGVGWGVYKAAFGVSFGVVFTGVFLTELLPGQSSLRRGLEDGAGAALDAIEERKLAHHEPLAEEPFVAPPAAEAEPAAYKPRPVKAASAARTPAKRPARPRRA